jgi:hypothetical protein
MFESSAAVFLNIAKNKEVFYNILFEAASETLQTLAGNPKRLGAEIGFIAILHTWGQNLLDHPHLHCVVPAGGLAADGSRWKKIPCGNFLFKELGVKIPWD